MSCPCCSEGALNLLYSCSGSSNAGEAADKIMRKLKILETGKGTCLAAVGADLTGFTASAKAADKNIVIDGCPIACGEKIMEKRGIEYVHILLSEYGVEKGKTEITDELINSLAEKIDSEIRDTAKA